MPPQSAGILLYRRVDDRLEVLIVHPSGNYNRKAPWSIPKGLVEPGETLESAARRETAEEIGIDAARLVSLGEISYQKSRKRVHCFAAEASSDAEPRCASWEIDGCRFVPATEARDLLHPDQRPFIDRLERLLTGAGTEPPTSVQ